MFAAASHAVASPVYPGAMPAPQAERRDNRRIRTVYRLAPVSGRNGQGLARVRNISDGGLQLETQLPVELGERVQVALSDTQTLQGQVVWTNGNDCGIQFEIPIDSAGALRASAEAARSPGTRQPRLPLDRGAVAVGDGDLHPIRVCDVSQRGMKIAHGGRFTPGMPVKIMLGSGRARRGVVRWSRDGFAGVLLTETFAVSELGRLDTL